MVTRTSIGFVAGLLISVAIALLTVQLLPGAVDGRLFITLMVVFPLWLLVLFYSAVIGDSKKLLLHSSATLLLLALFNLAVH